MKKRTLVLALSLCASICVLLYYLSYTVAKNIAIAKLSDEQLIHARQATNGIEEHFKFWSGVLSSFAKMDDIIRLTNKGRRDMRLLLESHSDQIRSITRMNERGFIVYTYPFSEAIGSDISNQAHVKKILAERKPVVSDVFRTVQGHDAVALHVPVFKGDIFSGSIAIVINFETLAKRHLDVVRIGKTGRAWVVSRDGTQLYSSIHGFAGRPAYENYRRSPSALAMLKDMLRGHEGSAVYTYSISSEKDDAAARRRAVYMPARFGDNFWSVVVDVEEREALSELASFRKILIIAMFVIFMIGAFFSIVIIKALLIVKEEQKRKKVEADLVESERRHRELFEHNPAPMIIFCKESLKTLAVNDAFVYHFGYSSDRALQMAILDFYPEEDKNRIKTVIASLKGHAHIGEWRNVKADGSVIDVIIRSHDIEYLGHDARIAVITDISDLKRTKSELEKHKLRLEEMVEERTADLVRSQAELKNIYDEAQEANKRLAAANEKLMEIDRLKSMFIASMSHELRTPLNSIIGFSSILLREWRGALNNDQKEDIAIINRAGRHLLALISDVIDVSKIEAGRIDVFLEDFDVRDVINEALDLHKMDIGRKCIELRAELCGQIIHSDRKRLLQCVANLLSNAVKFTEKGVIMVSNSVLKEKEDVYACIIVKDTGIGIKKEDLPKLFSSFVRLDSPLKEGTPGVGLGLYLTKKSSQKY